MSRASIVCSVWRSVFMRAILPIELVIASEAQMFGVIATLAATALALVLGRNANLTPEQRALMAWRPAVTGDESKDRFIAALFPLAQRVAPRFGLHPAVLIAQAALESGWSRSGSMTRGNALWGVKVGRYTPTEARERADRIRRESRLPVSPFSSVTWNTHEETVDGRVQQSDTFRVYDNLMSGAADYADLVTRGRYDLTRSTRDPYVQLGVIWGAGYATSRRYIQSVSSILRTIGAGPTPAWIDDYQEEILALRDADTSTRPALVRLVARG
jgi:hypothetical protein